jgi:hypothetical protein
MPPMPPMPPMPLGTIELDVAGGVTVIVGWVIVVVGWVAEGTAGLDAGGTGRIVIVGFGGVTVGVDVDSVSLLSVPVLLELADGVASALSGVSSEHAALSNVLTLNATRYVVLCRSAVSEMRRFEGILLRCCSM